MTMSAPTVYSSGTSFLGEMPFELQLPDAATPSYFGVERLATPGQTLLIWLGDALQNAVQASGSLASGFERVWSAVRSQTPITTQLETLIASTHPAAMSALEALDAVRSTLGLTFGQVATITGIGRTTFHYWRREGADPRPGTVRPLWRLTALAKAIDRSVGMRDGVGWLRAGSPSPLDLLLAGDLDSVEDLVSRSVFTGSSFRRHEPTVDLADDEAAPAVNRGSPARRSGRRPSRGAEAVD